MRDNKGFRCHVHHEHVSFEMHHVWPLGYHGPDVASNRIKICPNAHSDIHFLMELMFRDRHYDPRQYGWRIRYWAKEGYDLVTAYAESLSKGAPHG